MVLFYRKIVHQKNVEGISNTMDPDPGLQFT